MDGPIQIKKVISQTTPPTHSTHTDGYTKKPVEEWLDLEHRLANINKVAKHII